MTAAIILAAGTSQRLGRPKQLLPLDGRALLSWTVEATRVAGLEPIVVVLGHAAAEIIAAVDLSACVIALNEQYNAGMSTSLNRGLSVLPAESISAIVLTCDQPLVPAGHLRALVDLYQSSGKPIVATDYGTFSGVPMLLGREIWPMVATISGDQGARALLRRVPEQVSIVPASDPGMAMDVDTEAHYEALVAYLAAQRHEG